MSNFQVVGLMGAIGAGKDTVADKLVKRLSELMSEYIVVKVKLTAELHKHILDYYGESYDLLPKFQDRLWKEIPYFPDPQNPGQLFSPREALIYHGTTVGRAKNPDVWLNALDKHMRSFDDDKKRVFIISDVRFENEAQYVVNNGLLYLISNRVAEQQEFSKPKCAPSEEFLRQMVLANGHCGTKFKAIHFDNNYITESSEKIEEEFESNARSIAVTFINYGTGNV